MKTVTATQTKTKGVPPAVAAETLKQVATMQKTAVALADDVPEGAWGTENVSAKDIIIPKILLMQGQSSFVTEGIAMVGQLIDSVSKEVLGGAWGKDKNVPVEFIPFYTFRTWVESRKNGEKFDFVRQVPMTASNEDLPVEFTEGNDVMRRDRCINVYALLPRDLEAGAGYIPYVISFRRTSFTAGKKLSSFLSKLADFGKPAAAKIFRINVLDKENDKGKFKIFDIEQVSDTPKEYMAQAYKWYKKVQTSAVKVDDSDLKSEKVVEETSNDDITF